MCVVVAVVLVDDVPVVPLVPVVSVVVPDVDVIVVSVLLVIVVSVDEVIVVSVVTVVDEVSLDTEVSVVALVSVLVSSFLHATKATRATIIRRTRIFLFMHLSFQSVLIGNSLLAGCCFLSAGLHLLAVGQFISSGENR